MHSPLPWGERENEQPSPLGRGGPATAFSPAVAGRVRGLFRSQSILSAKDFASAILTPACAACPLRRNPTAAQNAASSSLRDRRLKVKVRKAEERVKWQIANVKSRKYARSPPLQFAFCVLTCSVDSCKKPPFPRRLVKAPAAGPSPQGRGLLISILPSAFCYLPSAI